MNFNEINSFTYTENVVTIDGNSFEIDTSLDSELSAVQYHQGKGILEEPLMVSVSESKYQYAIDEWVESKNISELPAPAEDPQEVTNRESLIYLASTDWYVTRRSETGVVIPQDILDARAAARAAIVIVSDE